MFLSIAGLILSLIFILLICSVFTNSVEWLGKRLNLGYGVIGSIFAAIGTALPETIIPIIAILFTNSADANNIGIGAIAGAPFMLSTLGFFITGFSVLMYSAFKKRNITMNANSSIVARDLTFFIILYGIAILTTFFREINNVKSIVSISLVLLYIVYIKMTIIRSRSEDKNSPTDEFYLTRLLKVKPNLFWIMIELILALVGIVIGSHFFVTNVDAVSGYLRISPLILSILITPIATELPEKLNSVIWIGKQRDTLALGNITGAMVFQSCIPVAFGIMFTPWNLSGITLVSAILALLSGTINLLWVKSKKSVNPFILLSGGAFYFIFLLYLIFI